MSVVFRNAMAGAIQPLSAEVPDGAIVGLIGEETSGTHEIVRLAAGVLAPAGGDVTADDPKRLLSADEPLRLSPVKTLGLEHALAKRDALVRARAAVGLERLRRDGATILLLSHEQDLLVELCDEVWWVDGGRIAARGSPCVALDAYNRHVADKLAEWGASVSAPLAPSMRRGDGRARILAVETLGEDGRPTMVWRSGCPVAVRVTVKFDSDVEDPVVGIMLRTRIGFEVYGTNTELENVKLGPVAAGQTRRVTFRFPCGLCPQEYTVTAASHDPNGVWHDWLEDAVAFSVVDRRHTAGVANLRAQVEVD